MSRRRVIAAVLMLSLAASAVASAADTCCPVKLPAQHTTAQLSDPSCCCPDTVLCAGEQPGMEAALNAPTLSASPALTATLSVQRFSPASPRFFTSAPACPPDLPLPALSLPLRL